GLIETCEESGSPDLPAYLEALAPRMGDVALVIALDSGAGNYDQLWVTTSLRGLVNGTLRVDILTEGVHSGDAGGVVPSSFRIARQLLDRIDDSRTGMVKPAAFACEVPKERLLQAQHAAQILGDAMWKRFPWATCCDDAGTARLFAEPATRDPVEMILNRTWRAALAVTGADGLPPIASAGNVQRPYTSLKLSLRLPPKVDGAEAAACMKKLLEEDPPYNARISFEASGSSGWNAPSMAPWLSSALDKASKEVFGKPAAYLGEGGTIPFMSMLNDRFPGAQILVTGVLGPKSNAHGPNEFLDITYAKSVCSAAARVIAAMPAASVGLAAR
ncbi:MAG: peptidase dimerization domain-containing protein, partial [Usitatibacter sp.]